jgi:hypothetical protein
MSNGYGSKQSTLSGAQVIRRPGPRNPRYSNKISKKPSPGLWVMDESDYISNKESKIMNFIKSKLRNWLFNDDSKVAVNEADRNDDSLDIRHRSDEIRFSVVSASGGKIVQVTYYDERKDNNVNKLHIITPDEDLAVSLAQILQIEQLSR